MNTPVFEKGVEKAKSLREDLRPAPSNNDDPRARAAARAAEIRDHRGQDDDNVDEFRAPTAPDGWEYQWKRKELIGKEDVSHQNELARNGWEPVPVDRHPEMAPLGTTSASIELKGMVLMECPKELVDDARNKEKRRASDAVSKKAAQLEGKNGNNLLSNQNENTRPILKKSYSPMKVPE